MQNDTKRYKSVHNAANRRKAMQNDAKRHKTTQAGAKRCKPMQNIMRYNLSSTSLKMKRTMLYYVNDMCIFI